MYNKLNKLDELSRRKFIQYSAKALLGVGLSASTSPLWASQTTKKPTARNAIYINLHGGMSHIDTFDPKAAWKDQGDAKTINTNVTGIQISDYLPGLAKRMDKLAIIRSMHTTQGAHAPGKKFMSTSYAGGTLNNPGLGAWLNNISGKTNSTLPGNVRIGGSSKAESPGRAGFLGAIYEPLFIAVPENGLPYINRHESVDKTEMRERLELAQMMNLSFDKEYPAKQVLAYSDLYDEALKMMKSKDLSAFELSQEPKLVSDVYGNSAFGKGCLLARRLVEHGVGFVEVTLGNWDSHADNHKRTSTLANSLDTSISALLDDLHYRGLLDETLVVIGTEFGRTPMLNTNSGRDHHPQAFSCVLAGGGIKGGQVYGSTDATGTEITENGVTPPDFNATIAYALGLPIYQTRLTPSGREVNIAGDGRPVTALF